MLLKIYQMHIKRSYFTGYFRINNFFFQNCTILLLRTQGLLVLCRSLGPVCACSVNLNLLQIFYRTTKNNNGNKKNRENNSNRHPFTRQIHKRIIIKIHWSLNDHWATIKFKKSQRLEIFHKYVKANHGVNYKDVVKVHGM